MHKDSPVKLVVDNDNVSPIDDSVSKTVLLVEDETAFAEIIRDYLQESGYRVEMSHTGVGVIDMVRRSPPDLLLLDNNLPGIKGTAICEGIREFSDLPIIMVTARVDEMDRLLGYDLGVDDYICKPVKPREVLVRVKAVMRRFDRPSGKVATSLVELNEELFSARVKGQPLDLTPVEFRLLQLFTRKTGRVFSRTQIMDSIYEGESQGSDRSVDSHIKNLRKKLAKVLGDEETPIHSVYGLGYKFEWGG